jgi:hypothetical protein
LSKQACCTPDNLVLSEQRPQVDTFKCQVCGARHIEVTLEPGQFGITLVPEDRPGFR